MMRATGAIILLSLVGCSDGTQLSEGGANEVVALMDLDAERRNATSNVFSAEVDPEQVVATVGEHSIHAADVAAYLRIFPALSVEQAVEDLVDTHLARTLEFEPEDVDVHDARVRGRVIAWLRSQTWENEDIRVPDPAAVAETLADPASRTVFGTPALVTASHVLINAEGEDQTPEREAAAEELARRVRATLADLDRPIEGADLILAAYETMPPDDPLLEGTSLTADPALVFPREYAGPANWNGIDAVVPEFGQASFDGPLHEVLGPVRSQFGWHLIVVESRTEDDYPTEPERQRIAEERQLGFQRGELFQQTVHRLILESQVVVFEENVALMALSAEERVQIQAGENRERFNN